MASIAVLRMVELIFSILSEEDGATIEAEAEDEVLGSAAVVEMLPEEIKQWPGVLFQSRLQFV